MSNPKEENAIVDELAKGILIMPWTKRLATPSNEREEVVTIRKIGGNWMEPIIKYPKDGILPESTLLAQKIGK